jgi:hypothetical protein
MTDIIIFDTNFFKEIKQTLIQDESIKLKYTELFKKYNCFSNNQPIIHHKHKIIKHYNHHHPIRETNIKKQILGILNLINNSNYLKLFNKIKIIINIDNIKYIISEILNKCCLQIFYVHVFMKLFINIYEISQKDEKDIIIDTVNTYVNNFINNKEYILSESVIINAYDYFCFVQKHKSLINAKNIIILELFKYNILLLKQIDYIEFITKELNICICESHIELLLNMLLEIHRSLPIYELDIDYQLILDKTKNQKIKFMVDDLQ